MKISLATALEIFRSVNRFVIRYDKLSCRSALFRQNLDKVRRNIEVVIVTDL